MQSFVYRPFAPPAGSTALRRAVRDFVAEHMPSGSAARRANSWIVVDRQFSRALGKAGYLGMTWPKAYGGHKRSALERYIVLEELLAAGAPVGAHWFSDRQTGPLLLRYGTEAQRQRYLPSMARGECIACIGLSEPGAGSDLAAVRSTARREPQGGWRIQGQKVWTTNAHEADVMLALLRSEAGSERHEGLSQFLIDLKLPGITVRPIHNMAGEHEFNEVFFDDVRVADDALVGTEGGGWAQVTAELSLERSGPERYLSSLVLFNALVDAAGASPPEHVARTLGQLAADFWTLRQMSLSTAAKLAAGEDPTIEAAIVKDLGNDFEQALPQVVQGLLDDEVLNRDGDLRDALQFLLQTAPSFSLRGGTREVMRGIIARGLGLR